MAASLITEFKAKGYKYRLSPVPQGRETFWRLEVQAEGSEAWQQLASNGKPVLQGHLLPTFALARKGAFDHSVENTGKMPVRSISYLPE